MAVNKVFAVLLASYALLRSAHGELLLLEGFNYPGAVTNLAGLNGGTGWNGAWVNVNGVQSWVQGGDLVAGANAPAGYDARSIGGSVFIGANHRSGRLLDCSVNGSFGSCGYIDGAGLIGADGKTLYISFLQQPSDTAKFYEFEFHRGDLGDPGRIAGVGNDFNSTTVNLRAPNSTQAPLGTGSTNVSFYLVRIDFRPGNDDVYVYRNPVRNAEDENEPTLTMLSVADMSFDGISLAAFLNGVTVLHDEIRLGETWGDVLGGPPAFVLQPTNQNLYAGQTAVLVTLAESAQSLSYQWSRGDTLLPGKTNATLMIPDLQLSDADGYCAIASNSLGAATSVVATLTVQLNGISLPGQAMEAGQGSNLISAATFGGTLPATFQWLKEGAALPGQTNATLSISNTHYFDAGQYVLVASNVYGIVTSQVLNVHASFGAILAYEGFNYPQGLGNLPGQNSGLGWGTTWANIGGNSASISNASLSAGTNGPVDLAAHSSGNSMFQPNNSRSGRFLDCSAGGTFGSHGVVDGSGNIGADGKTIYVSFLQQPDGTAKFYEFEFHRGDLGDAGRLAGVGNDTDSNAVYFRAPNGTQNSLGPGSTNVNFYVVRIDFKPGSDDVRVYRNPGGASELGNVPVLTMSGVGDMSFNGISLGSFLNNRTVKHDEVRLGLTWSDVVGGSVAVLEMTEWTNGSSRIRIAASPNHAYQLQGAPIAIGPWTNVARVVAPQTGVGEFVETNMLEAKRFYRAMAEPLLPVANLLLADFEGSTYGDWVATGTAFGSGPVQGTLPNQGSVTGYLGAGLVNSFYNGDTTTGTLTSPPFTITANYLSFLIGGGGYPGQTCMNLLVDGVIVRTATGSNTETLLPVQWDVSALLGKVVVLQIVDMVTGYFGHIEIDQIMLSDKALPALTRQMLLTNNLLNFPVKNGSLMRRVGVVVNGTKVRDFDIELADATPDWWAVADMSSFQGQTATVTANALPAGSAGLSSVVQSNGIVGATNLYHESLRPQIHFSSRRGWLNDANAMVYLQGEYHLYYQHNPYGWNWGNMHWGHAVSPDMIHWQELPVAIYPHAPYDVAFSGSGIIDWANTGGFKTGTNDVIVAAYTSTGRGECIAYSNDRGRTFVDYINNPVVVHNGRDPHLLWYAPSNYWVMAVYNENSGSGISFYSSPNLCQWTYRSRIAGFYECPDLFQMPVDGQTNNMKWVLNDASGGYMVGEFNGVTFTPETAKLPCHSGWGFYASQTYTEMPPGDSRRVRIGWAWIAMPGMPFNQMMYFPTELTLLTLAAGVRLCSQPISEITNLHVNTYEWTNLTLSPGANPFSGIRGKLFDLRAEFAPGSAQTIDFNLCGIHVIYNPITQQISCNGLSNALPSVNGTVKLQIITDSRSIEIFGNDGRIYMPMEASYAATNNLVSVTSQGGVAVFNSLTISKLKSAWP